jgi:hypothetical protein
LRYLIQEIQPRIYVVGIAKPEYNTKAKMMTAAGVSACMRDLESDATERKNMDMVRVMRKEMNRKKK